MNTSKDIKKGLKCIGSLGIKACSDCVWHGKGKKPCTEAVMDEAVALIEALEERISLMLIQMQGDCGCCKHRGSSVCNECLSGYGRPLWEYEGLPEIGGENE